MADKKQIYPPSVQESLMTRIRTLAKKDARPQEKKPEKPGKEPADWKAAVGYGPLVLRLGSDAGKPQLPRVTTLGKALVKERGKDKGTSVRSEEIVSFDCWYAVGSGADRVVCQYTLRRTGDKAEGSARRTAPDGSYDKPFTAAASALDGLQTLVKELKLRDLGDDEASGTDEGCHLAVWYASGESIRCRDTQRCRLSALQTEAIRRWFEVVAGI